MSRHGAGVGAGSNGAGVMLRGRGRAGGLQGGRWVVGYGNVEHLTKLSGLLDVPASVDDGAGGHCWRPAFLRILGPARHVEAAAELVGRDSRSHVAAVTLCKEQSGYSLKKMELFVVRVREIERRDTDRVMW